MVTRKWLVAAVLAVGPWSVVAQHAAAESEPVAKVPVIVGAAVDQQVLHSEIDSAIRAFNEQLRKALTEELRHSLPAKLELVSNELRARG
jgi:hypothetical protein